MQFSEGKERNRDEILANFQVGLELLGRTESQTGANAEVAIYVFEKFVILKFSAECDSQPQFLANRKLKILV
ncbi:MAG TPA: hypothetical protein DIW81_02395 [Planctomycetaceae bacterium]|nr:hypothetical protein [Planctomycetaceae bacterium]|tara:strand:- start:223 stop:438 length:216 start_codon:yes stop_codon:yes gene_type:complete